MARKKTLSLPPDTRRAWVEPTDPLSIRRQCRLAGLSRCFFYYTPTPDSEENLRLMRLIDEKYMRHPELGSPRIHEWLREQGFLVNHKRVERLMNVMGLQAITPGPHTSRPAPGNKIYPYLLRNIDIERVNQVWSTDITYIPMARGFFYLTAVIDWHSRYVLSWELSNSLDCDFCVFALEQALSRGTPEIFNTDQGSQFTSSEFTSVLLDKDISISMDGRGRALDNVFIERLWWTVKYENVYPKVYASGHDLHRGLSRYFQYTTKRGGTRLLTGELRRKYSRRERFEQPALSCRRSAPPSALRAAPAGIGLRYATAGSLAPDHPQKHGTNR